MPKHAKTKKQKKLTDLRRKTDLSTPHTFHTKSAKSDQKVKISAPINTYISQDTKVNKTETSMIDYHYLRSDLLKTIFLTASIAATQLIIYFFIYKI